jgi:tetratricopeptide (TPR) repeat protein
MPELDEHGFPVPPTFDDPEARRRRSEWLGYTWQVGLVLVFIVLLAGWVFRSGLGEGLNDFIAGRLVDRAEDKLRFGDLAGALTDLERAAQWAPANADIFQARAQLKFQTNDLEGSIHDFDRVIELAPRNVRAYLGRSIAYERLGRHAEAIDDVTKAIGMAPDEPDLYELRAQLKIENKDVEGSLKDYERLIQVSPKRSSAYLGRSVVYQRLQRHREAIDDLTKAIELDPDHATPRNNRAYARAIAGVELEAAFSDVERAIALIDREIANVAGVAGGAQGLKREIAKINAQKAAYLDTRGYLYFLQNEPELALKDLNSAIELSLDWQAIQMPDVRPDQRAATQEMFDRNLSVMYHHRGQVLEKLDRHDEAKSDLDRGDKLGYNPAEGVF